MAEWFRALDLNLEVPGSNPPYCFLDLFYGSPELEFNSLSAASHQLGFLIVYVLIEIILFVYLFYLQYPQLVKCIAIHLTPIITVFFLYIFAFLQSLPQKTMNITDIIRSHGTVFLIQNKSLILGTGIKVDVIHSIKAIVIKH